MATEEKAWAVFDAAGELVVVDKSLLLCTHRAAQILGIDVSFGYGRQQQELMAIHCPVVRCRIVPEESQ